MTRLVPKHLLSKQTLGGGEWRGMGSAAAHKDITKENLHSHDAFLVSLGSELLFLELLQPPHNLAHWFLELSKPLHSSMVSPDYAWMLKQVRAEMPDEVDHCQHFFTSDTVVLLHLGEGMDAISNNHTLSILLLEEHSTYPQSLALALRMKVSFG